MTGDPKLIWRRRLRSFDSAEFGSDATSRICRFVSDFLSDEVPPNKWIVVYDPLPEELNVADVLSAHPAPSSRFAVTRTPDEGFSLTIHPLGSSMERHRYGYMQPRADAVQIGDSDIGAVLVPALGFDLTGNRLGRGKGYYDRFLARLADAQPNETPLFVGIAGARVADELPVDDHDVAMTHIALTTGVWPVPIPSVGLQGVDCVR